MPGESSFRPDDPCPDVHEFDRRILAKFPVQLIAGGTRTFPGTTTDDSPRRRAPRPLRLSPNADTGSSSMLPVSVHCVSRIGRCCRLRWRSGSLLPQSRIDQGVVRENRLTVTAPPRAAVAWLKIAKR